MCYPRVRPRVHANRDLRSRRAPGWAEEAREVPASCSQARFVYLSAPYSATDPGGLNDYSVAQAIRNAGASAVAGWDGPGPSGAAGIYHDAKVFEYLSDQGMTVTQAFAAAATATEALYGNQAWLDDLVILGSTTRRIAPAFS